MLFKLKRKKIVSFLVSGNGFIFSSIARKILQGGINAKIGCVITDNPQAKVIQRASALGITCKYVDSKNYESLIKKEEKMIRIIESVKTDLLVAAGYMRMFSPQFVERFRNKIINVHPSLLPSFPGLESQRKAFEYGVKVTGCTTHFIDEGMDTGPIIMQAPIFITESDTADSISMRILHEEIRILIDSVRLFCEGKIKVIGRKIIILN